MHSVLAPANELVAFSATRLADLIRRREVTAVEVVEAHLERIADVNPALNAIVQLDAEGALRAARAQPGGPLHGVPFTVKDVIETAGLVAALGVAERTTYVPARDATVVARVRAAGGILLGKTNCPPWGGGSATDNPVYGRTNNPYDLERSPGGSSGGEAAAIAAGLSPFGLGSDSGGSLRQPAHFCGLACLKPTAWLVPLTGMVDDEGDLGAIADPRTQIGPMARFVEDVELLLSVVGGAGALEPDVPPVSIGRSADVALRGMRAAVHTHNGIVEPTRETVESVHAAARALAAAGVEVEERPLPAGGHELTVEIWRSYVGRLRSDEVYRVFRRWDAYRRDLLAFLEPYDLIVCPVAPVPAFEHEEGFGGDGVSFTTPFSLTGWPAAVVRAGSSPEGLPIGVQLVARQWRDDVALAAAAEVERTLGGWQPPDATRRGAFVPAE